MSQLRGDKTESAFLSNWFDWNKFKVVCLTLCQVQAGGEEQKEDWKSKPSLAQEMAEEKKRKVCS